MSKGLTNPLQALIQQASTKVPAETGATAHFRARLDTAGTTTVLLCDVSSSMDEGAGSRRKFDHLQEAVDSLIASMPGAVVIAFSSQAHVVAGPLPQPSGGTAMHLALDAAALHKPRKTIVVSDGEPDSEKSAMASARRLKGQIDVIYCGSDSNKQAIAFMQTLAREGAGTCVVHDLVKTSKRQLATHVQRLALPPAGRQS